MDKRTTFIFNLRLCEPHFTKAFYSACLKLIKWTRWDHTWWMLHETPTQRHVSVTPWALQAARNRFVVVVWPYPTLGMKDQTTQKSTWPIWICSFTSMGMHLLKRSVPQQRLHDTVGYLGGFIGMPLASSHLEDCNTHCRPHIRIWFWALRAVAERTV